VISNAQQKTVEANEQQYEEIQLKQDVHVEYG
jgi:hypothetical protein